MNVREMLATAMEIPISQLAGVERLGDVKGWDSMAILNFMALADAQCGVTLSPDQLLQCGSMADLETLLAKARATADESVYQVH